MLLGLCSRVEQEDRPRFVEAADHSQYGGFHMQRVWGVCEESTSGKAREHLQKLSVPFLYGLWQGFLVGKGRETALLAPQWLSQDFPMVYLNEVGQFLNSSHLYLKTVHLFI